MSIVEVDPIDYNNKSQESWNKKKKTIFADHSPIINNESFEEEYIDSEESLKFEGLKPLKTQKFTIES